MLEREAKRKTKKQLEAEFRAAVWARDEGKSRASGRPLKKSAVSAKDVGEVHHVLARSTDPDKRLDVSNGILLSREEHMLAETACPANPMRCLLNIDGPLDRGKPQRFVWLDVNGKELKRRTG